MTCTRWVPLAALLLTAGTPAYAAPEEGGGLLDPNAGLIFWQIVVFLAVLGLLMKFAFPPILGAVEAREQRIRELLDAAARDRAEAEALLEQQRTERDATRAEVHEIIAEGRAAAERMREEILAEARREQQELLERTRRDVHQEVERAAAELRVQAVELAIAAASRLVERRLDDEDDRRLVREYLDRVEVSEGSPVTVGV
jgi:F-type H+-transporting ATPase subunit b